MNLNGHHHPTYLADLSDLFDAVEAEALGAPLDVAEAIGLGAEFLEQTRLTDHRVYLVGNGGSAAVASHVATDAVKNAGLAATVFTDAALLTCLANDHGYPAVYARPIEVFGRRGDLLIAISSSGRSDNILLAAEAARAKQMGVITLTGFDPQNSLRRCTSALLHFYVPSNVYGYVEITHLALLHGMVDAAIAKQEG